MSRGKIQRMRFFFSRHAAGRVIASGGRSRKNGIRRVIRLIDTKRSLIVMRCPISLILS